MILPGTKLKNNRFYRLTASGSAAANLNGASLDGSGTGAAGTPYVTSFAQGRRLTYIDRDGNRVTFVLHGPGLLHLTRTADGQGATLSVVGTTAATKLDGTVRHTRMGGHGTTTLAEINGLDASNLAIKGVQLAVSKKKP